MKNHLTCWARLLRSLFAALLLALCGLPAQAQAVSNSFNQTRTSSFTYLANGLLDSETIEPGDAPNCVVTTYAFDGPSGNKYGNKTSATAANCAAASGLALFDQRSSSTAYAASSVSVLVGGVSTPMAVPAGAFATTATNAALHTEVRSFDPRFGSPVSLTGPNSLVTTWQTDDFGRTVLEVRADGTQTRSSHCLIQATAQQAGVTDLTSNSGECSTLTTVTPTYLGLTDIHALAVRFVHTVVQSSTSGTAISAFTRTYFDRAGRKIRVTTEAFDGATQSGGSSRLIVQDTIYNEFGAVTVGSQPYFLDTGSSLASGGTSNVGGTLTEYDALGRAVEIYTADPLGSVANKTFASGIVRTAAKTSVSYSGLNTTTTDDKGRTRLEEKNPDGKVVRVTDALGAQVVHQHDANGNLITTKDALNNLVNISYDIRGRKLSINDPDAGATAYCYDALGQLKAQQSSNQRSSHTLQACPTSSGLGVIAPDVSNWTTLAYDKLGRMTSRRETEYITTWSYDKYADDAVGTSTCAKGVGKLCEVSTSNGITRKFAYDPKGRPTNSLSVVASSGPSFASELSYDTNGRVATQTYPTGLKVSYQYTGRGYLQSVSAATAITISSLPRVAGGTPVAGKSIAVGDKLWEAKVINAWGRFEQQTLSAGAVAGEAIDSMAQFDPNTGRMASQTAKKASTASNLPADVMSYTYTWNSLGQLAARSDVIGDALSQPTSVNDTFFYDALGRLIQYTVSGSGGSRTVDMTYNALGMMLSKSDVGNYSYPGQTVTNGRPHALTSVAGASYTANYLYDLNGNVTNITGSKPRKLAFTSFNMPDASTGIQVTDNQGVGTLPKYTWRYDENHQRFHEIRTNAQGTRATWNLHPDNQGGLGFEREEINGDITNGSNRHYISFGGQAIAVIITTGSRAALTPVGFAPPSLTAVVANKLEYWHKDHLGSLVATSDHKGNVTARYAYDPFGKRRSTNASYDPFGNIVVDWTTNTDNGTDRGYTGHEHLDDVGLIHMNGRIFDPMVARFMQADPFIQDPLNLQNFDRYGYCYNNPLTCTDPSGYSFWTSFRNAFVRAVAFVADIYGCAGYCSAAVGAYQGYKAGGVVGGIVGGITAFAGYQLGGADGAATNGFFNAASGCLNAAASGGKCGRGAVSGVINPYGQGSVLDSALSGCLAGIVTGGSCRRGAGDNVASYLGSGAGNWFAEQTRAYVIYLQNPSPSVQIAGGFTYDMVRDRWGGCECFDLARALQRGINDLSAAVSDRFRFMDRLARGLATIILNDGANSEGGERIRGLPPEGVAPPVEGEVKPGPASRPSERDKGGQSLWDDKRGEWRYSPEDKWHNPHWDYNPHDKPSSPWQNVPIGPLPPRK